MEGNVKLLLRSRSKVDEVEDELLFDGTGTVERTAYGWCITYDAAERESGQCVRSRVQLEQDGPRARLQNDGAGYTLCLDPAQDAELIIPTPQGDLRLQVQARQVFWALEEDGCGSVALSYSLLAGGQPVSCLQVQLDMTQE